MAWVALYSKAVVMLLSIHFLLLLSLYSGVCIRSFFCDGDRNFLSRLATVSGGKESQLLYFNSVYVVLWTSMLRDRSLFKCQGRRLKEWGHVKFHVSSRGVAINFDFPAGGGGHV